MTGGGTLRLELRWRTSNRITSPGLEFWVSLSLSLIVSPFVCLCVSRSVCVCVCLSVCTAGTLWRWMCKGPHQRQSHGPFLLWPYSPVRSRLFQLPPESPHLVSPHPAKGVDLSIGVMSLWENPKSYDGRCVGPKVRTPSPSKFPHAQPLFFFFPSFLYSLLAAPTPLSTTNLNMLDLICHR